MRTSVAAVTLSALVLAAGITYAGIEPRFEPKVFIPGKALGTGQFLSVNKPTPAHLNDVPASVKAAIVGGLPKTPTPAPAQTFTVSPSQLKAAPQNGQAPKVWLTDADLVTSTAAFFNDHVNSSSLMVTSIPPGSWFIDCTLGADDSTPFRVLFGDGPVTPNVDTIAPTGGHLVLGVVVKNYAQLQISRAQAWAWQTCKFEAI